MWLLSRILSGLIGMMLVLLTGYLSFLRQPEPQTYMIILFSSPRKTEMMLADLNGQIVRQLAAPRTGRSMGPIVWRSDSKGYIFLVTQTDGYHIYYGHLGSQHLHQLTQHGFSNDNFPFPYFSPDNRWIMFVSGKQSDQRIHVVPTDGSQPPHLLNTGAIYGDAKMFWLDNDWIIYEDWRDGRRIYRIHRNGGDPQFLSDGMIASYFRPQSEWLLVEDQNLLYRVNINSGVRELLLEIEPPDSIEIKGFSSEGRWINVEVFYNSTRRRLIYRADPETQTAELIFSLEKPDIVEAVSPAADKVVIRRSSGSFYLISTDNPSGEQIPFSPTSNNYYGGWGPDGELYFGDYDSQPNSMFRYLEASNTLEQLNPPNTYYVGWLPEMDGILVYDRNANEAGIPDRILLRIDSDGSVKQLIKLGRDSHFYGFYELPVLKFRWLWLIGGGLLLLVVSRITYRMRADQ